MPKKYVAWRPQMALQVSFAVQRSPPCPARAAYTSPRQAHRTCLEAALLEAPWIFESVVDHLVASTKSDVVGVQQQVRPQLAGDVQRFPEASVHETVLPGDVKEVPISVAAGVVPVHVAIKPTTRYDLDGSQEVRKVVRVAQVHHMVVANAR